MRNLLALSALVALTSACAEIRAPRAPASATIKADCAQQCAAAGMCLSSVVLMDVRGACVCSLAPAADKACPAPSASRSGGAAASVALAQVLDEEQAARQQEQQRRDQEQRREEEQRRQQAQGAAGFPAR